MAAAVKADTTIDVFAASDLRVGTIVRCEPVPKSKKLLRLEVDLGEGKTRQILSGVAESFTPDELTGQQALFIANLPPRVMMGLESHGMMLVASDADGKRILMQPKRLAPNGVQVG